MSVLYATTNTIAGIHTFTTLGDGSMGSLSNLTTRSTHSLVRYQQSNVSITGFLNVSETVTVSKTLFASNIQVLGDFVTLNTITSNTEQMVIENAGTGPALKVTQTGNNSIAEFYDKESGVALFVGNGGNVGVGTNMPLGEFHIAGSLSNVVVDSRGYLGVGTTVPVQPFHVEGNAYINGNLSAGNMGMFRNRIINGDMRIAQRGTSTTTGGKTYLIDRFSTWTSITTGQLTTTQNTLTSSDLPYQYGFRYSNKILVTTAVTSYSWVAPVQPIEGSHVSDLMWGTSYGSPVTLSFWLKTNATGQHSIAIRSGANGITNYNVTLNISVANTWGYYIFNIPAPPSGTTWATDFTNGIEVFICPLFGTNKTIGWTSIGNYIGVTGSVNWPATLNNYIEFTGIQFEKGNIATPFEFRPYALEVQLCQRYYEKTFNVTTTPANNLGTGVGEALWTSPSNCGGFNSNNIYIWYWYKVNKRTSSGTLTLYNCRENVPNTLSVYGDGVRYNVGASSIEWLSEQGVMVFLQRASTSGVVIVGALTIECEL